MSCPWLLMNVQQACMIPFYEPFVIIWITAVMYFSDPRQHCDIWLCSSVLWHEINLCSEPDGHLRLEQVYCTEQIWKTIWLFKLELSSARNMLKMGLFSKTKQWVEMKVHKPKQGGSLHRSDQVSRISQKTRLCPPDSSGKKSAPGVLTMRPSLVAQLKFVLSMLEKDWTYAHSGRTSS